MRTFMKLAVVQTKLYLREPMAVFFTLLFGPLMLIMMGFIFGSKPQEVLNGLSQMDISVPAYIALIVGITGLMSIPIGTTLRRESGVLRRFSATPLKPLIYFLTDILAPFLVNLMGVALLISMGLFIYKVRFVGNWLSLFAGVCLCTLSFFTLGYAMAGLFKSARVYTVLGNVIIIPITVGGDAEGDPGYLAIRPADPRGDFAAGTVVRRSLGVAPAGGGRARRYAGHQHARDRSDLQVGIGP
jgi:ABC-2 type transport system permease protein